MGEKKDFTKILQNLNQILIYYHYTYSIMKSKFIRSISLLIIITLHIPLISVDGMNLAPPVANNIEFLKKDLRKHNTYDKKSKSIFKKYLQEYQQALLRFASKGGGGYSEANTFFGRILDNLLNTRLIGPPIFYIGQYIFFRNPLFFKRKQFFVLKENQIYVNPFFDGKETRKYVSLHRKIFKYLGPYVAIAFMPPGYQQPIHKHHYTPEFNFFLDSQSLITFENANKRLIHTKPGELFCIPPEIQHTISNNTNRVSRNIVVKINHDYRILSDAWDGESRGSNQVKQVEKQQKSFDWGNKVTYIVQTVDNFCYAIEFMKLKPGKKVDINRYNNRNREYEETVLLFSPTSIVAQDIKKRHYTMSKGDVLYIRHNKNFTLRNTGDIDGILYRVVFLKYAVADDQETEKKDLPFANVQQELVDSL